MRWFKERRLVNSYTVPRYFFQLIWNTNYLLLYLAKTSKDMDKRFLKEDGSLDIEGINNLPIEEYVDVVGKMTDKEYIEYSSIIPLDECKGPVRMIYVDYELEDDKSGVDGEAFLNELIAKNKLRLKNKGIQ